MRIAFIILAHKHPGQAERLARRLYHPQVDCYVHLDAKSDMTSFAGIRQEGLTFIDKRANVNWGGFGTVQAALNGIEAVLASGKEYVSISLISAQDYPLEHIDTIYAFFSAQAGKNFMEVLADNELQRTMSKITDYHFEDIRFRGKYRLQRIINSILPKRKTPLGMKAYGGSLWWSLHPVCAAYCLQFIEQHPAFKRFYKYTWGGDEFIFQTIIMNHPQFSKEVVNDNLRYIDWSEGNAHPKTFEEEDYNTIVQSGKLLARKFDLDKTPVLLDRIDDFIAGKV